MNMATACQILLLFELMLPTGITILFIANTDWVNKLIVVAAGVNIIDCGQANITLIDKFLSYIL